MKQFKALSEYSSVSESESRKRDLFSVKLLDKSAASTPSEQPAE